VDVYLSAPLNNRLEYTGVIKEADEQNLTLSLQDGEIVIPLETVNKGQEVI
jgi:ribosome maturation factor RimP